MDPSLSINYEITLSQNFANISDSWISSGVSMESVEYFSNKMELMYFTDPSTKSSALVSFYIYMGAVVTTTSRVRYTMLDAMSNVGGFSSIVYIIFLTAINRF